MPAGAIVGQPGGGGSDEGVDGGITITWGGRFVHLVALK